MNQEDKIGHFDENETNDLQKNEAKNQIGHKQKTYQNDLPISYSLTENERDKGVAHRQ